MKKSYALLISLCCLLQTAIAQYAPQAGITGSTAISATSGLFAAWATDCSVQRGFMDIGNPSLGYASTGDSSFATGPVDNGVVSLGDSGVATLTFAHPIYNGAGPDFAVFENGFLDPADSSLAFLELGFVEVSSDGVNYFRFPATSLTQTTAQANNDTYLNATGLDNLAGKYIGTYGTPFDLDALDGTTGLDVNNITHVRVIDVIGSIGAHASRDHTGNIINDPYPTAFPSCGFDLDAVGVINELDESVKQLSGNNSVTVYPNPATDHISIAAKGASLLSATITTITGSVLLQTSLPLAVNNLQLSAYPRGMYYLVLSDTYGNKWTEKIILR